MLFLFLIVCGVIAIIVVKVNSAVYFVIPWKNSSRWWIIFGVFCNNKFDMCNFSDCEPQQQRHQGYSWTGTSSSCKEAFVSEDAWTFRVNSYSRKMYAFFVCVISISSELLLKEGIETWHCENSSALLVCNSIYSWLRCAYSLVVILVSFQDTGPVNVLLYEVIHVLRNWPS